MIMLNYNTLRLMKKYNDDALLLEPKSHGRRVTFEGDRPIMRVEQDFRSIQRNLNTIITDLQSIKSDIAEIKLYIKKKEKQKVKEDNDLTKGWFYF